MRLTCFPLVLITACACLLSACTDTSSSAPAQAGFFSLPLVKKKPAIDPALQAFLDGYDRYFGDSMQTIGPPGAAVVVVKDSMVVLIKGYGEKSAGSNDPVDSETVFRIGSLSKGFAGVLTGIFVEKGWLKWDDPVQQYLPEFSLKDKKQAERIQLWHLLSHSTGLPYHAFDNLIEQGFDRETIFKNFMPWEKLFGKEGEFYRYQNAVFCAIEPVLESVGGKSYPELLTEKIFHPAGMNSASCDFESMRQRHNKALPHHLTETGWVADTISPRYYGFTAAGGVNASIASMGEWLKLLLGHKPEIVADSTLDAVFRPVIKTGVEKRTLPGWIARDSASYAMGWRILEKGDDTFVYHAGFVNNFYSEIALNRRDGIGICILFNGNSYLKGNCIREFFDRWRVFKNPPAPPAEEPVSEAPVSE